MWMIIRDPRPQCRMYRSNRAHVKPLCHDGSSFPNQPVKKGEKTPKDNSSTSQARSVSFNKKVKYINDDEMSYMDTQSMMFASPETCQKPPASPSLTSSPPRHHSPRSSTSQSPLTSPLAPYRLQQQAKSKAQQKIITHK